MIVRPTDDGVEISIRAQPRASRTEVAGRYGDRAVRIRLTAPPVDGAANDQLEEFLAEVLGVGKGAARIVRGHGGRSKVVRVTGVGPEAARRALEI